jgi:hypothetical protein
MSKSRKTFKVHEFRENINNRLRNSRDDQRDMRRGMLSALEGVLHATGNYQGFGYLNKDDMVSSDYGTSVGINTHQGAPSETLTYEQRFENTDDSRVHYF